MNRARASGLVTSDRFPAANTYVICVDTLYEKLPDLSNVEEVLERIAKASQLSLVCIESTMLPGSTRKLTARLGLERVAVVPHRYWSRDVTHHGVSQTRVMGALNDESRKEASELYGQLGIPLHVCRNIETAELAKVVENTHRYLEIAYAEEVKRICDELAISYSELKAAVDTKWNVKLLEPRDGIGGSCLPKDVRFLLESTDCPAPLIEGALSTERLYRTHVKSAGTLQGSQQVGKRKARTIA